jgi:hypothetical protein
MVGGWGVMGGMNNHLFFKSFKQFKGRNYGESEKEFQAGLFRLFTDIPIMFSIRAWI